MKSLAYCIVKSETRKELTLGKRGQIMEIELPRLKHDEVLLRIKAAGLNYNSLWSLQRQPADPFQLVAGMVRNNPGREEHLRDYLILGSDAAGIVVEAGSAVTKWVTGDEVVVHCNVVDTKDPIVKRDELLSESQAIWGYETNFGAFATYAIVKEQQLHRRPQHLTWEESASYMLTFTTAYRMLLSTNGAQIKQGETCLIWGAAGGLGLFAVQLVKMIGAIPIAVVSSDSRADVCRDYGAEHFIFRNEMKHQMLTEAGKPNPLAWREIKQRLSNQGLDGPDVVFEHIGRETLGASVYLARRGGRIVTCAASSGYESIVDLRYLWMQVKRVIGSHIANSTEAAEANMLIKEKKIRTTVSAIAQFSDISDLIDEFHDGKIVGKAVVSVSN